MTVAFKGDKMEVLATGDVMDCLTAYDEAKADESYDFVGMLRKPTWHKRSTPKRSLELTLQRRKNEEARAAREAEYAKEEEARLQAKLEALRAQRDIEAAKADLKKEDAKAANDAKNAKLQEMEKKQRESRIEEALENQVAVESDKGLAPSTEDERAALKGAPKKKTAKKK